MGYGGPYDKPRRYCATHKRWIPLADLATAECPECRRLHEVEEGKQNANLSLKHD